MESLVVKRKKELMHTWIKPFSSICLSLPLLKQKAEKESCGLAGLQSKSYKSFNEHSFMIIFCLLFF